MELVSNEGTVIQLLLSAVKLIGRGAGVFTTDRTIAKHHVSLKAEEAFVQEDDAPPLGKWWEKPPLKAGIGKGQKGLRAWLEILGPNPICVLKEKDDQEGKFEVKFIENGEGCWLLPGDQLSLSIVKPSFFTAKKAGAREVKESDTVDRLQKGDREKDVTREKEEDVDRKGKRKVEAASCEETAQGRTKTQQRSHDKEEESRGPQKRPSLQGRKPADGGSLDEAESQNVEENKSEDERPASLQQEDRAGPSGAFDPVKEYGLIVEGAEFDQYDQKRLNNTRPWTWQIRTSKGDDEDSEGGPFSDIDEEKAGGRGGSKRGAKASPQKKRMRSNEEDEWTGDSDEEAEDVEEVGKGLRGLGKAPAVATRSHDRPRGKKGIDSDVSEGEESGQERELAAGKNRGAQNETKAGKLKRSKAEQAKEALVKGSSAEKGATRKKKSEEDSEESEDDEPTAEDLDFIVDDEEESEEEEEESEEEWEDEDDQDVPKKRSKAKQSAQDMRPMCRYGAKCYRKNPDHLKQYRHP